MDLTQRILNRLRGRLGITVSHPDIAGRLKVVGATNDALRFGWHDMPEALKVPDRAVFLCGAEWSGDPFFVFADEVEVVDAPADMVVEAMLDMMDSDAAYDLEHPGADNDDDDDWICEGAP